MEMGGSDLLTVSHELLLEDDTWDRERTIAMGVTRANLLWAIGTGKSIDLPHMMYMAQFSTYGSFDPRGSVPFIGFLMELFKRHDVPFPIDLTRTEPKKPIGRYSLTRSEGQRKKKRLEASASEQPSVGILELQEAIANLRVEFDTRMTSLEEQSGCHTTMLQKIKGMLIRMQSKNDDDDDKEFRV
ncbi:hypothetical protein Acr_07g0013140 [Actinidia rufa]|uniref:Uncharacterized protein n=1 Tax=Actinidia rufa TaxID=165716 RepID=A0A7J0EXH6_9ERIC|nr:hypothetical protein Acr_07g0013140 [Actinidia rufa]